MNIIESSDILHTQKVKYFSGTFFITFAERLLVATNDHLYVFKHGWVREKPLQIIPFSNIQTVFSTENQQNGFQLVLKEKDEKKSTRFFTANKEEEMIQWKNLIWGLIVSCKDKQFQIKIEKNYLFNSRKRRPASQIENERVSEHNNFSMDNLNKRKSAISTIHYHSNIEENQYRDDDFITITQKLESKIEILKNEQNHLEQKLRSKDRELLDQKELSQRSRREAIIQHDVLSEKFSLKQKELDEKYERYNKVRSELQKVYDQKRNTFDLLEDKRQELMKQKDLRYDFQRKIKALQDTQNELKKQSEGYLLKLQEKDKEIQNLTNQLGQKALLQGLKENQSCFIVQKNISEVIKSYEKIEDQYGKKFKKFLEVEKIVFELSSLIKDDSHSASYSFDLQKFKVQERIKKLENSIQKITEKFDKLSKIFDRFREECKSFKKGCSQESRARISLLIQFSSVSSILNKDQSHNHSVSIQNILSSLEQ